PLPRLAANASDGFCGHQSALDAKFLAEVSIVKGIGNGCQGISGLRREDGRVSVARFPGLNSRDVRGGRQNGPLHSFLDFNIPPTNSGKKYTGKVPCDNTASWYCPKSKRSPICV